MLLVAARAPIGLDEIAARLADLPGYARPGEVVFTDPVFLVPAGTPDRAVAAAMARVRVTPPIPGAASQIEGLLS